ncbi:hypothetical protein TWF225_001707 [Orbilia oligospora]|uniref:Uncharacterized protein n=1 Tax=Orbilia oligospora TaxID=2813651 RepID=A0A7C8JXT9_ORBOL|nr:hypothetical protein TWF751_003304 [Orbilia oligospora]KAF3164239.1 hypothetical protein TWF225_001707 [Orbilia oligospora]KAF3233839.1 hypothetical protein TWF128_002867 [Orbilia oligospora]KAF3250559.1 hypothetical protein TWF217_008596 [Orbilia oligospora]KAF3279936.1 hypothetical protein TWF132_011959 [Orbilia oligospora]
MTSTATTLVAGKVAAAATAAAARGRPAVRGVFTLLPLQSKKKAFYSTSSAPSQPDPRYDSPINAPLSTLPAHLDLPPPRKPGESLFGYYFKIGKGYLSFYKTGLKNAAWVNPRLAGPVMSRWRDDRGYAGIVQNKWITRSDLQLLKRNQHDFRRIPLFAVLFTVCGEFTPFVVALFSNIVPITCRIPSQIESDRKKREHRIKASFEAFLPSTSINRPVEGLDKLTWKEKVHCSTVVGRHSGLWPSRILPLPFGFVLHKRLSRYEVYISTDDLLIAKGGGVMKLSPPELGIACVDRGIRVLGKSEQQLRAELQRWLTDSKKGVTIWERWLALPTS